jgi:hypothetical protein
VPGWLASRPIRGLDLPLFQAWASGDREALSRVWEPLWASRHTVLVRYFAKLFGNDAIGDVAASHVFDRVFRSLERHLRRGTLTFNTLPEFQSYVDKITWWRAHDTARAIARRTPARATVSLEDRTSSAPRARRLIDVVPGAQPLHDAALADANGDAGRRGDEDDGAPMGRPEPDAIPFNEPFSTPRILFDLRMACGPKEGQPRRLIDGLRRYADATLVSERFYKKRSICLMEHMGLEPEDPAHRRRFDHLMWIVRQKLPAHLRDKARRHLERKVRSGSLPVRV